MRGLGSDMANTVCVRERREAAAVSWQVSERGREGSLRGVRGADMVCVRERWGGPRQRDDERGCARGVQVAERAWLAVER